MSTSEINSPSIIVWGIAAGVAMLSMHGGLPQPEILQTYALVEIPQPNSRLDIIVAVIGGVILLFHYLVSNRVEGMYQIAFIFGVVVALVISLVFNPAFTLVQRAGLVVGGMVGTLTSMALDGYSS